MPLQKILFKPGVNRENTRYTTEGGWYECNKIRFRQGNPEVIGGWKPISGFKYNGICRSLWNWVTLNGFNYMGVGTNTKFYVESGGYYNDITPIRSTVTLPANPFTANGTTTVSVYSPSHGAFINDFVTFSGATGTYASTFNQEYQITSVTDSNNYKITVSSALTAGTYGGSAVSAAYQLSVGPSIEIPLQGWSAGSWGNHTWGNTSGNTGLRLWSQNNWGENLLFAPKGGTIYYWQNSNGLSSRGQALNSLGGNVTITAATPALVTATIAFTEGTALQFGGNLPPGMSANTTYYVYNVNGLSFNLLDASGNLVSTAPAPSVQGVVATGGVGQVVASQTGAVYATGVQASGNVGSISATVSSSTILLNSIQASGSVGTVSASGVGATLTGNFALGGVGTVTRAATTFALSGVSAAGNVGTPTVTGIYNAYISLIVDVPLEQNFIMVSDTSRFVLAFGVNDYGSVIQDPMLIRWSNQEDLYNWTPDATNQAGYIRLSHGSKIVTAVQTRQEIVVLTDASIYSLQYLGPPYVWRSQLLGDNVSISGSNTATLASGVVYWMGVDKFYMYDGRVQTLNCDLRRYIFSDINMQQKEQFFASTNEGFNEVWWFYCSITGPDGTGTATNPNTIVDKYVVYNYLEKIWYYGTMQRTAWIDSGLRDYPEAATYYNNLVDQEYGLNANDNGTDSAINAYISSSEFDIGDGHNFGFVWRILPDLTFDNSTAAPDGSLPQVTMTLYGLSNSGSGVTSDAGAAVQKSNSYVITEEFTGQVFTRFRGRQIIFQIGSNQLNTSWQLGAPRIDIRPDGRR
jgi:hypothetical protein